MMITARPISAARGHTSIPHTATQVASQSCRHSAIPTRLRQILEAIPRMLYKAPHLNSPSPMKRHIHPLPLRSKPNQPTRKTPRARTVRPRPALQCTARAAFSARHASNHLFKTTCRRSPRGTSAQLLLMHQIHPQTPVTINSALASRQRPFTYPHSSTATCAAAGERLWA